MALRDAIILQPDCREIAELWIRESAIGYSMSMHRLSRGARHLRTLQSAALSRSFAAPVVRSTARDMKPPFARPRLIRGDSSMTSVVMMSSLTRSDSFGRREMSSKFRREGSSIMQCLRDRQRCYTHLDSMANFCRTSSGRTHVQSFPRACSRSPYTFDEDDPARESTDMMLLPPTAQAVKIALRLP